VAVVARRALWKRPAQLTKTPCMLARTGLPRGSGGMGPVGRAGHPNLAGSSDSKGADHACSSVASGMPATVPPARPESGPSTVCSKQVIQQLSEVLRVGPVECGPHFWKQPPALQARRRGGWLCHIRPRRRSRQAVTGRRVGAQRGRFQGAGGSSSGWRLGGGGLARTPLPARPRR
jgi:hypothetical protein